MWDEFRIFRMSIKYPRHTLRGCRSCCRKLWPSSRGHTRDTDHTPLFHRSASSSGPSCQPAPGYPRPDETACFVKLARDRL
ncbi:hypothetical protein PGTUg99_033831 [Puccinia graminis f. sp. tritici]|uniref:Uncharacterized protein n=1 Tax=Puccinia graminis f. sp. tritici TaxID=56615 RepID=A0A5B0NN82_PUCGR|nr:hypothetical protein PGTUg99_033831 [Puccinia graminis f. sp. tritici]